MTPAMTRQADLFEDDAAVRDRRNRDLIRAMAEAASAIGLKEIAYAAGLSPATVANALACRDRKEPPLKLLGVIVDVDPEHRLLHWLADRVGCDLTPREHRTPEEQLSALKAALNAQGPVGRLIARQAGVSL